MRFEIITLITKFQKYFRGSVIFNKVAGFSFSRKQQVVFFHVVYGTILSICSIVLYQNWNFFGLSMAFYMSKIFLRYGYSVCILLLVFLQFLEMVQSFQMSNILSNVAAESYFELDGSSPNARLGANAIENSPQSTPFFATALA